MSGGQDTRAKDTCANATQLPTAGGERCARRDVHSPWGSFITKETNAYCPQPTCAERLVIPARWARTKVTLIV